MVGGMKESLKISCLKLERGRLATVLVVYEEFLAAINFKRQDGLCFLKPNTMCKIFCPIAIVAVILNPVFSRAILFKFP